MEKDFQTSFIPKKPMIQERAQVSRPVGLLTVASIFLLITMLVASGGLYFYKAQLTKKIQGMQNDLALAKGRFEPSKIVQLQVLDKRLKSATDILGKHITLAPIFKKLQNITMKTVGYTKFGYTVSADKNAKIDVKMSGIAKDYTSIALQADLFTPESKIFIDPVFSNLSLDTQGNVLFELEFSVAPSFVDYKQTLQTASAQ